VHLSDHQLVGRVGHEQVALSAAVHGVALHAAAPLLGLAVARLEAGALFLQGHAAPRPVVASAVLRAAELPSADPHQALEVVPPFRALRVPEAGLVEAVVVKL